jgi:hypothetical protein
VLLVLVVVVVLMAAKTLDEEVIQDECEPRDVIGGVRP